MRDQIKALLAAMHNGHEVIARLYEARQGILAEPEDEHDLTRLLRMHVVRRAHDETYRLESNVRRMLDKGLNRHRQFGISTHYSDILANLRTAVDDYLDSLVLANEAISADRLGIIFELCDDFASGMMEDLERFRNVVQTNTGFTGCTLSERIRYNENRHKRAEELLGNLLSAMDEGLLERASAADDLALVLQRELFSRHGDLANRMSEVAHQMSSTLFLLRSMDERSVDLMRLDNHLSRATEFGTPDWSTMDAPAECFMRFEGFEVAAYPDPENDSYFDEVGKIILRIRDEPPEADVELRGNEVVDKGVPAEKVMPSSRFSDAFFEFIEAVLDEGCGSAVEWVRGHRELFEFDEKIWLQIISNHYANKTLHRKLGMPDCVKVEPQRQDTGTELLLLDFEFYVEEEAVYG